MGVGLGAGLLDEEQDARLIVEAGEKDGVRLDVAAASAERLERAAALGHADEDMAAAYFASFHDEPASWERKESPCPSPRCRPRPWNCCAAPTRA
jgi:hypothetical protein